MSDCRKIRSYRKPSICLGDLRHPIQIMKRKQVVNLVYPPPVESQEDFTLFHKTFAAVRTKRGSKYFNGVAVQPGDIEYIFLILYVSKLSLLDFAEHFILYRNIYYRIVNVENLQEDRKYIELNCTPRGVTDKEASKA